MLAHYHGQIWNSSEFGRSFGVSHTTVRKYLDLLSNTFVVRQLPPWTESVGKRVVKSPKVFIRDTGILHTLLGLERPTDLEGHPKVGASWEGFAMNAVIRKLRAREDQCYFWATHGGAELGLLVVHGNRRRGFEFKRTDSPRMTTSMRVAFEDLNLDRLDVVHAGSDSYLMQRKIRALALRDLADL
jgi:predicted AAA+ superfamily ATPase